MIVADYKTNKGRGKSYNYKKLEELIDQDLSTEEIAKKFHTSSLQSIRHATEKIKRKRRKAEALERKREYEVQREKRQQEETKRRYASVNQVGLLQVSVDDETLKALNRLMPCINSYRRGEMGFIHHNDRIEIFVYNDADLQDIRGDLFRLGFYIEACNRNDKDDILNIKVIPNDITEGINYRKWISSILVVSAYGEVRSEIEEVTYDYVIKGYVDLSSLNDVYVSKNVYPEMATKNIQKWLIDKGIHAHLRYDPMLVIKANEDHIVEYSNSSITVIEKENFERAGEIEIKCWEDNYSERAWSWHFSKKVGMNVGTFVDYMSKSRAFAHSSGNSTKNEWNELDPIIIPIVGNEKILNECEENKKRSLEELDNIVMGKIKTHDFDQLYFYVNIIRKM